MNGGVQLCKMMVPIYSILKTMSCLSFMIFNSILEGIFYLILLEIPNPFACLAHQQSKPKLMAQKVSIATYMFFYDKNSSIVLVFRVCFFGP